MKKKPTLRKRLTKNLLSRYRLVILNEENYEEQFFFRLSILNLLIISIFLFSFLITGTLLIVSYTPVKEFIPGYASNLMRKQAIINASKLDSITISYNQSLNQLNSIKRVLTGDIEFEEFKEREFKLDTENIEVKLNSKKIKDDSLLRKLVEQQDKYNFSSNINSDESFLFFSPVLGYISQKFDPSKKHFAIDVVAKQNQPVRSIADGVVIFSEWSSDTGYVIILEHKQGYLSVYKHNESLNNMQGDIVRAGDIIGTVGNTGEYSTGHHLHFELWNDGYPLDPQDFIDFSP
ncbi:MAG: M23 family metallopeptidase [Flavobacteriaceae bacterium]|tara:strand:+ start:25721 stop:26593 length:873 start_codon:yes stop_codon:yes gene_type:complete